MARFVGAWVSLRFGTLSRSIVAEVRKRLRQILGWSPREHFHEISALQTSVLARHGRSPSRTPDLSLFPDNSCANAAPGPAGPPSHPEHIFIQFGREKSPLRAKARVSQLPNVLLYRLTTDLEFVSKCF
jgi:hypothetical protein